MRTIGVCLGVATVCVMFWWLAPTTLVCWTYQRIKG